MRSDSTTWPVMSVIPDKFPDNRLQFATGETRFGGDAPSTPRLRGADVKAANRYGLTPIQLAASNGHAAMIEKLLAAGVDPNFANPGGETVLMRASRTGNMDAIRLLLARGANVNAKESERGQTALMWAVLENHADVVKLLLARGADMNAKTTARTIKGEYTPARAAGAAGPGIIRQRALPTAEGGMTALLFAVRD